MQHGAVAQQDRRSKERFRLGCSPCRNRQVPCDQAKPKCLNCLKLRLPCDGGAIPAIRKPVNVTRLRPRRALVQQQPYSNAHEGRAFHFVAIDLAPLLGSLVDEVFWVENVLPAAYQDQRLFYAVLAYSSRFHNDTWARDPHHERQIMQWYNKSINQSIVKYKSSTDIFLNVKMCIFYAMVENKHGNPQSGSKMMHTAFNMVASLKNELEYSEDAISTLCWLADITVTGSSGNIRIPASQYSTVCNLGISMSQQSRHRVRYELSFRLWQIMYDVDTLLLGRKSPVDLKTRIDYYEGRLADFHVTPSTHMIFLRFKFLYTLSRLQSELYRGQAQRTLRVLVKNLRQASEIKNCRKLILDTYIGPGLGFLAWHFRQNSLHQDIANIMFSFNQPDYQSSLGYWLLVFHVLLNADRREIALEIWGEDPRVLRIHHWLTLIRLGGRLKTLASVVPFLEEHPQLPPSLVQVSENYSSKGSSGSNASNDGESSTGIPRSHSAPTN